MMSVGPLSSLVRCESVGRLSFNMECVPYFNGQTGRRAHRQT